MAGAAQLAAGAYANSPGHKADCYTELAVASPSSSRNHRAPSCPEIPEIPEMSQMS